MTEAELRRRGYYLFGIDQNRFVQVRDVKTDKTITIGQGVRDALKKAEELLGAEDRPPKPRCFIVELAMAVTVEAQDHEEAEELAVAEAAAKLESQGIGCLVVQPAEETECDA